MLSYNELKKKYKMDGEEPKTEGPSPAPASLKKTEARRTKAEKSASASARTSGKYYSQGQKAEVVGNTGIRKKAIVTKADTKKLSGSDKGVLQKWKEKRTQAVQTQKNAMKSGKNAIEALMEASKKQTEAQKKKKSASFAAGLLEGMGGNAAKIAAAGIGKVSKNETAKKFNQAQLNLLEETKQANKGYGTAGALAGEFAKAGAGYATIGKAAEKAALKGVAKATGGKTLGKAGTIATKLAAQQAADTAVNTPMTIAAGMAEGKNRKDILKDIGKQEATDAAFNVGLEALGAGAKAAGKAIGNAKAAKQNKAAIQESRKAAKTELLETAAKPQKETAAQAVPAEDLLQGNGKEGLQQSGNTVETADFVVEDTAGAARAEQINEVTDAMLANKNPLAKRMTKEERKALLEEYANLQDPEYLQNELERINKETNGDVERLREAVRWFGERPKEIESILATQQSLLSAEKVGWDATDELCNVFGIKGHERKKQLYQTMDNLLPKIQNGTVTKEEVNSLFDTLYGMRGEGTKLEARRLKKRLEGKTLLVDTDVAANISDFHEWRKNLTGLAKVKYGGVKNNTDTLYLELQKDFPSFFPENIDNSTDRVLQIRKVAEQLYEGYAPNEKDYRESFYRTMRRLQDDLDVGANYAEKVQEEIETYMKNRQPLTGWTDYRNVSAQDVQEWNDRLYKLEQAEEEGLKTLSETERGILDGMLDGRHTEDYAKSRLGTAYPIVKTQYEKQKPIRKLRKKIEGYNAYQKDQRNAKVANIVGEINLGEGGWKDKPIPRMYGRETQERNIFDIAPKETAERIKNGILDPIHENERKKTLFLYDCKQKLKKTGVSTKKDIKLDLPETGIHKVSESMLVQWLGEKEYELSLMHVKEAEDNAAYQELSEQISYVKSKLTKKQLDRISNAISAFREVYKEFYTLANEISIQNGYGPIGYIENYFPHMEFYEPTSALGKLAQKLGFDFHSDELPMEISGLTEAFKPGRRWSGNVLKREGTSTDYDAFRAFDRYADSMSDVIFHTEDIQTLRSYTEYLRYHASDEGIRDAIDQLRKNKTLSIEDKYEKIQKKYEEGESRNRLQNYVNDLTEYTNNLAGKKHSSDRNEEKNGLGRKFYKVVDELESKVAKNMVAGNISSAMTNFIPMTQALGSMKTSSSIKGMKEALTYMGKEEMDELTRKSAFLATRQEPEKLYKNWIDRLNDAGTRITNPLRLMETVDTFSTQAVWRGKYYDNLGKGMTEDAAIKNADDYARGLFAGRSKGAMPTMFNSKHPLARPFLMFQLEGNNQFSHYLKDIPKEEQGNAAKIIKRWFGIAMGAYVFNDLYEAVIGRRPALDPFGIANEAIGDATGEKLRNLVDVLGDVAGDIAEGVQNGGEFNIEMPELTEETQGKSTQRMLSNLTENVGGQIPFVGGYLFEGGRIPISGAIPGSTQIRNAIGMNADGEADARTTSAKVLSEIEKPFWYLLMPTAGSQIRKTTKGLQTMLDGGSYSQTTDGERLQFAVDQESPKDWLQTLMFGKYATDNGKAYMDDFSSGLGASQTETYEKLKNAGLKNTTAFETINEVSSKEKAQDKRNAIRTAPLSKEQKAILYQANAGEKDQEILTKYRRTKEMGEVADCLMNIADCEDNAAKKAALRKADISDETKEYIYMEKLVNKDDWEKEWEKLGTMQEVGVGMTDYIAIRTKYGELYNAKGKRAEKEAVLSELMKDLGLTTEQRARAYRTFSFKKK